jgi:hypothetical protein
VAALATVRRFQIKTSLSVVAEAAELALRKRGHVHLISGFAAFHLKGLVMAVGTLLPLQVYMVFMCEYHFACSLGRIFDVSPSNLRLGGQWSKNKKSNHERGPYDFYHHARPPLLFIVTPGAVLRQRYVKALHPVMTMFAEITLGDNFFLHLVTLTLGEFLKVAGNALEAACFHVVVVAEMDGIRCFQGERYVTTADRNHRGYRGEQE